MIFNVRSLSSNIAGTIPDNIQNLINLQTMYTFIINLMFDIKFSDFTSCGLIGTIPQVISNLQNLKTLYLS